MARLTIFFISLPLWHWLIGLWTGWESQPLIFICALICALCLSTLDLIFACVGEFFLRIWD